MAVSADRQIHTTATISYPCGHELPNAVCSKYLCGVPPHAKEGLLLHLYL